MPEESKKDGGGDPNIVFLADSMKIYGPKLDGSFTVTFGTGEYEQLSIVKLMAISQHNVIKVTVEPQNEQG